MVKFELKPIFSASALRILANTLWNVPICKYLASSSPTNRPILSFISLAALFVNVSANIFHGLIGSLPDSLPFSSSHAILYVSTLVFPDPAPAITRLAPSQYSTATR